jgi:hypothetical protein
MMTVSLSKKMGARIFVFWSVQDEKTSTIKIKDRKILKCD